MKLFILLNILFIKFKMNVLNYSIQSKQLYYTVYINTINKKDYDTFLSKHMTFFLKNNFSLAEILALYKGDISTFVEFQIMKLITK